MHITEKGSTEEHKVTVSKDIDKHMGKPMALANKKQ
jgi:hypothetical protein